MKLVNANDIAPLVDVMERILSQMTRACDESRCDRVAALSKRLETVAVSFRNLLELRDVGTWQAHEESARLQNIVSTARRAHPSEQVEFCYACCTRLVRNGGYDFLGLDLIERINLRLPVSDKHLDMAERCLSEMDLDDDTFRRYALVVCAISALPMLVGESLEKVVSTTLDSGVAVDEIELLLEGVVTE